MLVRRSLLCDEHRAIPNLILLTLSMAVLTSDMAWRSIIGRTLFFAAVRSIDLIPLMLPVSGSVMTTKSDAPISRDSASLVGDVENAVTLQARARAN